jgi:hypothetical protein
MRSVSLYSVVLQALEPKSSPRRRRALDATDRGLTERSGDVFFVDILSHRMSEMDFSPISEGYSGARVCSLRRADEPQVSGGVRLSFLRT